MSEDSVLDATTSDSLFNEELTMADVVDLPTNTMGLLVGHMMNGAQRAADGAASYAENLRYEYLQGKNGVSAAEAVGERRLDEAGAGKSRNTAESGKTE